MTFGELFSEISFDYEPQYEPDIHLDTDGTEWVTFYKSSMSNKGELNRKGNTSTFDPQLYWKIKLMAKLLMDDPTVKVLYG